MLGASYMYLISILAPVICISFVFSVSFLERHDNFSVPESYFLCAMFSLKMQILLDLKAVKQ